MTMAKIETGFDFSGKVALMTGSSAGLGEAIALLFATFGAKVIITGRDVTSLERVAEECRKVGSGGVVLVVGDISQDSIQDKLINETLAHFGQLDILVNNAGIFSPADLANFEQYMKSFDETMAVNLRPVARLTSLAVPHLAKTKGNIINISSVCSTRGQVSGANYCASKGAMDQLTRCAAIELAPKGIRVNSVNPGPIISNITRTCAPEGVSNEQMFSQFAKETVLQRYGYPAEVAWNVAFLASSKAEFITGAFHVIDGGYLLAGPTN